MMSHRAAPVLRTALTRIECHWFRTEFRAGISNAASGVSLIAFFKNVNDFVRSSTI
jgi:hypothetical protein